MKFEGIGHDMYGAYTYGSDDRELCGCGSPRAAHDPEGNCPQKAPGLGWPSKGPSMRDRHDQSLRDYEYELSRR